GGADAVDPGRPRRAHDERGGQGQAGRGAAAGDAEGKFTLQTQLPDKKALARRRPRRIQGDVQPLPRRPVRPRRLPPRRAAPLALTIPPGGSDDLTLTVK